MDSFTVLEIKEVLIQKNKNVLILDTCCVLDIIRCVQRDNVTLLKSTKSIIEQFASNENKFEIVLPSFICTEWDDNYPAVMNETKTHIKKYNKIYRNLVNSINVIYGTEIEHINFINYKIGDLLFDFSEQLLEKGHYLQRDADCISRATERVALHTPPAAIGKDSFKDCVIFEEALLLSKLLRADGFKNKITFASSNTSEYYNERKLIPVIQWDLDKFNMDIVTSLNHGFYVSNI